MSKSTQLSMEERAAAILKRLKIDKAPIPVERIAKKLGATLQYEPFDGKDDVSGMLFRDAERTVIGINSMHPRTRQRFSIAHECGHLELHKGKMYVDARVNFRDAVSGLAIDQEEIEANAFAAALLMPQSLVLSGIRKAIKKRESHDVPVIVEELARAFDVSKQAMEIRLKNLGLIVDGE